MEKCGREKLNCAGKCSVCYTKQQEYKTKLKKKNILNNSCQIQDIVPHCIIRKSVLISVNGRIDL